LPLGLPRAPFAVLLLAGVNLALIHYVALSDLAALLGSNELVALLVLFAYFLGLSAGYLVSDRLHRGQLLALGTFTLALHATLPFSARWITGTLWRVNLQGLTPPFLFLLVFAGITPFYAVFLPRMVDAAGDASTRARRLVPLYATEIAGSLLGLGVAVLLGPGRVQLILALHLAGVIGLLALLAPERRPLLARLLVPVVAGYLALFGPLDRESLEYYYLHRKGFSEVRLLASELSPYQRVDVFEAKRRVSRDRSRTDRYLYLDGNLFYGGTGLHRHNLFVSILPGLVKGREANALVVAGGSLDAARYLAPRVGHLTVVELDEAVPRLTRAHIQDPRGALPGGWDLVIDDGKHFLGNWHGARFDLIAVDVPIPLTLQTAAIHGDRFFALAREKLAPGGIFSISLAGDFGPPDPDLFVYSSLGGRILAGLYAHFPHVAVVMVDDQAFAWATDAPERLPDAARLRDKVAAFEQETGTHDLFGPCAVRVAEDAEGRRQARGLDPIGEADMQIVLRLAVNKLYERFYEPSGHR
jgi:predicted membrane-bound spermidine synthase